MQAANQPITSFKTTALFFLRQVGLYPNYFLILSHVSAPFLSHTSLHFLQSPASFMNQLSGPLPETDDLHCLDRSVSLGTCFPLFQRTLKRGQLIDSLFTLSGKWLLHPSGLEAAFSF